jgi:shikimate dehydrogenase
MITARTRVFSLLGDPVHHSLSPILQNRAFEEAGVDGVFVALKAGPEDLSGLVRALSMAGGGGNVTLPHKEKVVRVLDHPSESVRRTGACNTFWLKDGQVYGDNTDVDGMSRALQRFLGRSADGMNILLLGAGGAARASLVALLDDGAKEITLLNRTTERARAVSRRIGGERVRVAENPAAVEGGRFDLVVNATRLGLEEDDSLPLELGTLGWAGAVMDLVYGPAETRFVRAARELGIQAADGGEMLVQQGAAAFERWWDKEAPVEAMRAALEEARARG